MERIKELESKPIDKRKKHCYNCKFAGKGFKVGKVTHHHCEATEKSVKPQGVLSHNVGIRSVAI